MQILLTLGPQGTVSAQVVEPAPQGVAPPASTALEAAPTYDGGAAAILRAAASPTSAPTPSGRPEMSADVQDGGSVAPRVVTARRATLGGTGSSEGTQETREGPTLADEFSIEHRMRARRPGR